MRKICFYFCSELLGSILIVTVKVLNKDPTCLYSWRHLIPASALVHLCRSRDDETKRLSLQTLELLAIENPDFIVDRVSSSPVYLF